MSLDRSPAKKEQAAVSGTLGRSHKPLPNNPQVGTVNDLFSWLIETPQTDLKPLNAFLASYPHYASTIEILDMLKKAFSNSLSLNEKDKLGHWERMFNFLQLWVEKYLSRDFCMKLSRSSRHKPSPQLRLQGNRAYSLLLKMLKAFESEEDDEEHLAVLLEHCSRVKLMVLRVMKQPNRPASWHTTFRKVSSKSPPTQRNSLNHNGKFMFDDTACSVSDMAEYMLILEWKMFSAIKEKEFYNLAWKSEKAESRSRHILRMIKRFNNVALWVATAILSEEDDSERSEWMKKFIALAYKCLELGNFNSMLAIVSGLAMHPVSRLKPFWEEVPEKYMDKLKEMQELLDNRNNYRAYRTRLSNTDGPVVPYLGVFLRDLTFIEEGNEDTRDGLINFEKMQLLGDLLATIQSYQSYPPLLESRLSLKTKRSIRRLHGLSEDELYEMSERLLPVASKTSAAVPE